jgi:hypothetical protein
MIQRIVIIFCLMLVLTDSAFAQSFRPRSGQKTTSSSHTQNRSLELRVLVDQRSPIGTSHDWMQALAEVGADRVVASSSRATKPSFEEFGTGSRKTLAVVGIVKSGKLHLPGGKFTIRQTAAIRNHLQKLRDDGAEVTMADKVAFGLTAKQLISVHDQLGAKIRSSTKGQNTGEIANSLLQQSGYTLSIDRATRTVISNSQSKLDVELEGFTLGTGIALALRKMGLALEPIRPQGNDIQLLIRTADEKVKNWPVGWPIEESLKKAAPKLYVKVDIRAQETPLLDLLSAIEGRMEFPFFYDHAKIAANEIDLKETKVTFVRPGKKSSYDTVIDKVLNQCKPKLKAELRIDEVGKRFLWITTRR